MSELKRTVEQWSKCDPKEMARMSEPAIMYALADAKSDVLRMHAELETLRAENETLTLYKNLADEYGLSIFSDLAGMVANFKSLQTDFDEAQKDKDASMTTDEIVNMAQQAGYPHVGLRWNDQELSFLERFGALAVAADRAMRAAQPEGAQPAPQQEAQEPVAWYVTGEYPRDAAQVQQARSNKGANHD